MAFTVGHIDHIACPTPDENIDKVKDFYERVLGFKTEVDTRLPNTHRMVFLSNGETRFEVYTGEERHGLRGIIDHFCIKCTGIDELAAKIKAEGYEMEDPVKEFDENGNLLVALWFFTGPCGERIELYENNRP